MQKYPNTLDELRNFMSLSFEERRDYVLNGLTPFFPKTSFYDAIYVNGNTDVELQAALTAADSDSGITNRPQGRIVVIDHEITLSAAVTVPENVLLTSSGHGKLIGASGAAVILKTNSKVIGVYAKNVSYRYQNISTTRVKVIGCENDGANELQDAKTFLRDVGTTDNLSHQYSVIALNKISNCNYGFRRINTYRCHYAFNHFVSIRGVGRMFENSGGVDNLDEFNIGLGGIGGHISLINRENSRGWYNNIVRFNRFDNISEEAISIDAYANYKDKMGVIDTFEITNKSGTFDNNPTLKFSRASNANLLPARQAALVMSGPLAGLYLNYIAVDAYPDSVFGLRLRNRTISSETFDSLVGQRIAIVMRADNNLYLNNTTDNCRDSIKLWGTGWHNVIRNNKSLQTSTLPHNDNDFAASGVAGLLSDTAISAPANTNALIPSNNLFANNDGVVGFQGVAYANKEDVIDYVDPMPNKISGVRIYNGQKSWERYSPSPWKDNKNPFIIEIIDTLFRPEITGAEIGKFSDFTNDWPKSNTDSGSITFPVAGPFVINHKLGTVPSFVGLTPKNASAKKYVSYVASISTITVTFSGLEAGDPNPSFDWMAE